MIMFRKLQILPVLAGVAMVALFAQDAWAGDSPWLVRLRGIALVPDESSTVSVIGGSIEVDTAVVPELDISYFFTDHIAVELVLATSWHDVTDEGSTLGNVDLGEVSMLPPVLSLQYHFTPDSQFRPYIGAGVNYTIFYNEDAPGGTVVSIDYENSFGFALQAGIDIGIDDHWAINFDVKKVFLNTDVSLNGGAITADVDLDPWLFGLGVAYRY